MNLLDLARRILLCLMIIVWVGLAWTVFLVRTNPDGNILTHYTNWNWLVLIGFLCAEFVCNFELSRIAEIIIINLFYVAVLASNTLVFYFVLVILHDNPDILLDEATIFGGTHYIGNVFVYNAILHSFPYVVVLYFTILMPDRIWLSLHVGYSLYRDWWYKVLFFVYQFVSSIFLPIVYICVFDLRSVYALTTSTWLIVLSFIVIWAFGVILPFIGFVFVFSSCYIQPKSKVKPKVHHRFKHKEK